MPADDPPTFETAPEELVDLEVELEEAFTVPEEMDLRGALNQQKGIKYIALLPRRLTVSYDPMLTSEAELRRVLLAAHARIASEKVERDSLFP